jgi:hypothetical protein
MEKNPDNDEKRLRIELFTKASYRFCTNPLKDEVKTWLIAALFIVVAFIVALNFLLSVL